MRRLGPWIEMAAYVGLLLGTIYGTTELVPALNLFTGR